MKWINRDRACKQSGRYQSRFRNRIMYLSGKQVSETVNHSFVLSPWIWLDYQNIQSHRVLHLWNLTFNYFTNRLCSKWMNYFCRHLDVFLPTNPQFPWIYYSSNTAFIQIIEHAMPQDFTMRCYLPSGCADFVFLLNATHTCIFDISNCFLICDYKDYNILLIYSATMPILSFVAVLGSRS